MYKYVLPVVLVCCAQPTQAINTPVNPGKLPLLRLDPFKFTPTDEKITKISQDVTLKINKDLFNKGIVLKAKYFGKYFAHLDASNLLELRYHNVAKEQDRFSSFQKQSSLVTGGLRLGQFVAKDSRLFLRVGFESEKMNKGNALNAPHLSSTSQNYWKTGLDSGLGFEHTFDGKLSIMGEVRTNLSQAEMHSHDKSESRQKTFLLGVKYFFGAEK
jgi:hypothetical protein